MNRIAHTLALGLLITAFNMPASEIKRKNRCCLAAGIKLATAITISSLSIFVAFDAHTDLIKRVRDEQNPCLTIWGTHPEFGRFKIQPPLCDQYTNTSDIMAAINREIGTGSIVYGQVTPCDTFERHKGPVRLITRRCIDKPTQITSAQIIKKQKTD